LGSRAFRMSRMRLRLMSKSDSPTRDALRYSTSLFPCMCKKTCEPHVMACMCPNVCTCGSCQSRTFPPTMHRYSCWSFSCMRQTTCEPHVIACMCPNTHEPHVMANGTRITSMHLSGMHTVIASRLYTTTLHATPYLGPRFPLIQSSHHLYIS
jgi:hypothetical protein